MFFIKIKIFSLIIISLILALNHNLSNADQLNNYQARVNLEVLSGEIRIEKIISDGDGLLKGGPFLITRLSEQLIVFGKEHFDYILDKSNVK